MKTNILSIVLTILLASTLLFTFNIQRAYSTEVPETEWTKTYGKVTDDDAYDVIQTNDGGYAIAGRTKSPSGDFDAWLIKTDESGEEEWNRTFGGSADDFGFTIIQTSDGGYAMACHSWSFGPGGNDFWLIKTDSNGYLQWDETYGYSGSDEWVAARSGLVETDDGGYALVGWTGYLSGPSDFWLVKTDASGIMMWNKKFNRQIIDRGDALAKTDDGGYIIAGLSGGLSGRDIWMVKTDADGIMEWDQVFGGGGDDFGHTVMQTSDGGYALAGPTKSFGAGSWDFWLIKTDSNGNMQWDETYGGGGVDYLYSAVQTHDGGFVLGGFTESFGIRERVVSDPRSGRPPHTWRLRRQVLHQPAHHLVV